MLADVSGRSDSLFSSCHYAKLYTHDFLTTPLTHSKLWLVARELPCAMPRILVCEVPPTSRLYALRFCDPWIADINIPTSIATTDPNHYLRSSARMITYTSIPWYCTFCCSSANRIFDHLEDRIPFLCVTNVKIWPPIVGTWVCLDGRSVSMPCWKSSTYIIFTCIMW